MLLSKETERRISALEQRHTEIYEVYELLLNYVAADLAKPWEPAAKALTAKLQECLKSKTS